MNFNHFKKLSVLFGIAITVSMLSVTNLRADIGGITSDQGDQIIALLNLIEKNTYNTLKAVNTFMVNLTMADTSQTTAEIQNTFATMGNQMVADSTTQNSSAMIQQLTNDLFSNPAAAMTMSPAGKTGGTTPSGTGSATPPANAGDLLYFTLLGTPQAPPSGSSPTITPSAAYNYIKNASGIGISHLPPSGAWKGNAQDQTTYTNYYNTVTAVASFNGYVLSNLYAENQNGNQLTTLQNNLVTQASSSNWLATMAGETIGNAIRQILIFQSQSYVLLTQLVQIERQILTAIVMNNALQILNNQHNESQLVAKAQGITPTA